MPSSKVTSRLNRTSMEKKTRTKPPRNYEETREEHMSWPSIFLGSSAPQIEAYRQQAAAFLSCLSSSDLMI